MLPQQRRFCCRVIKDDIVHAASLVVYERTLCGRPVIVVSHPPWHRVDDAVPVTCVECIAEEA